MGKGLGRLPGLPFDLDLELHKGDLSPHRKSGGREGEKCCGEAKTELVRSGGWRRSFETERKGTKISREGPLLGDQAVEW